MKKRNAATKICKHCKKEIPSRSKACPFCGKKQKASGCLTVFIVFLVLCVFGAIGGDKDSSEVANKGNSSAVSENDSTVPNDDSEDKTLLEALELSVQNTEMDLSSRQALELLLTPEDIEISKLYFAVSDTNAMIIEKSDVGFELISQNQEGSVTVTATADNIESNTITINIVDQERIAAEKKAEEERLAAEKAAEEKEEQERAAAQNSAPQQTSRTVYVTPTGKRYHYDNHCNDGTYIASTLDKAQSQGLTPCKKCAGG